MELKDIDLTEEDFKLMLEGLEYLPHKAATGELLSEILLRSIVDDPNARARFEAEKKAKSARNEAKKKELEEDTLILRGKLLLLKRYLQQAGALKQANDILKKGY